MTTQTKSSRYNLRRTSSQSRLDSTKPENPSRKRARVDEKSNIKVAVRVRGPKLNSSDVVQISPSNSSKELHVLETHKVPSKSLFNFDHVFPPNIEQYEVFEKVAAPLVGEVIKGFNCTIIAYGQTGTGKTYTMEGNLESKNSIGVVLDHSAGIIPRALHLFFNLLEKKSATIKVSMLELYNEVPTDLLSDTIPPPKVAFAVDGSNILQLQGLSKRIVENTAEGISYLQLGSSRRQQASTKINANSSRSHCIFTIDVLIRGDGSSPPIEAKLKLVDLAGSENTNLSGVLNQTSREAGCINKSLLALARVITTLSSSKDFRIPYRDSKLTRILEDSLGGNSMTCIVATVSPTKKYLEESLKTLKYASLAMSIKNIPEANATPELQIKDLETENTFLRGKLQEHFSSNDSNSDNYSVSRNSLLLEIQKSKDKEQSLNKELETLRASLTQVTHSKEMVTEQLRESRDLNNRISLELNTQKENNSTAFILLQHTQNIINEMAKDQTKSINKSDSLHENIPTSKILFEAFDNFIEKINKQLQLIATETQAVLLNNNENTITQLKNQTAEITQSILGLDAEVEFHNGEVYRIQLMMDRLIKYVLELIEQNKPLELPEPTNQLIDFSDVFSRLDDSEADIIAIQTQLYDKISQAADAFNLLAQSRSTKMNTENKQQDRANIASVTDLLSNLLSDVSSFSVKLPALYNLLRAQIEMLNDKVISQFQAICKDPFDDTMKLIAQTKESFTTQEKLLNDFFSIEKNHREELAVQFPAVVRMIDNLFDNTTTSEKVQPLPDQRKGLACLESIKAEITEFRAKVEDLCSIPSPDSNFSSLKAVGSSPSKEIEVFQKEVEKALNLLNPGI